MLLGVALDSSESETRPRRHTEPYLASFFMDSVDDILDFICVRCGRVRVVLPVLASVHVRTRGLYEGTRRLVQTKVRVSAARLI